MALDITNDSTIVLYNKNNFSFLSSFEFCLEDYKKTLGKFSLTNKCI